MPSTLVGAQSGGVQLVSGDPWSGNRVPLGGIQLRNAQDSSGAVYVGLSGGVTITSGGGLASGGMLDGMPVYPSDAYFVPRAGLVSGRVAGIYLTVSSTISGRVRVFWEVI